MEGAEPSPTSAEVGTPLSCKKCRKGEFQKLRLLKEGNKVTQSVTTMRGSPEYQTQ